mgnify:CR=1 FL=1
MTTESFPLSAAKKVHHNLLETPLIEQAIAREAFAQGAADERQPATEAQADHEHRDGEATLDRRQPSTDREERGLVAAARRH